MVRAWILLLGCLALWSCSEEGGAIDVAGLSDEARACLMGANAMIDVARQAVGDSNSRPERRESRRVLMEDWVARLDAGEDPCSVYEDIGLNSTTF